MYSWILKPKYKYKYKYAKVLVLKYKYKYKYILDPSPDPEVLKCHEDLITHIFGYLGLGVMGGGGGRLQ